MVEKSRAQKRAEAREPQGGKKLPLGWKVIMYSSTLVSVVGGWLYVSGWWSAKTFGCTVEISGLDDFVANTIAFAGAVSILTITGAFYHLENK